MSVNTPSPTLFNAPLPESVPDQTAPRPFVSMVDVVPAISVASTDDTSVDPMTSIVPLPKLNA